jgi:nitrate reductase gamma subunit
MNFFDRLGAGWKISMNSFSILKKNKQLIIFPVLSGISLLLMMGLFVVGILAAAGWDVDYINTDNQVMNYAIVFGFYFVNYFIVVFFNMALIHCSKLYFDGEEVTVNAGIKFSMSRIGVIFSWALFAATVGTILKIIQENTGIIGKIITGLLGIVWGVTTFFVVPVIAYENLGPVAAFKRSSQMMKAKWGESLGATFSLGLVQMIVLLLLAVPVVLIAVYVNPILGIGIGIMAGFLVFATFSAAETLFVSSVYHNITGSMEDHFDQQLVDSLFRKK